MKTPKNKLRILLADDSEEFVNATRRYLATQPWAEVVGHAHEGAGAVAQTVELKPDLVLMDVAMPGMGGMEATRRIRSLLDAPHVIMLSLHDTAEYQQHASAVGAYDYLSKAQFPHNLTMIVGELLDLSLQQNIPAHVMAVQSLAAAVEQTADAVMICDHEGTIQYVNHAFEQASGYRSEEAVGRSTNLLKSGEHPLSFYTELWLTIQRGEPFRGVFINRRKDGSLYHEQKTITPLKDKNGGITHFVSTAKDVTEQLQREQLLRESEERFRQVAENIHEVFWLTTPDKQQMLYISPGYETIWGRSCASLYAEPQSWLETIHPDDRERVRQAALTEQASGNYAAEYRIVRPDGTERSILDRAFPIHDTQGKVYRIAGIAEDITEQKHSGQVLQKLAYHDVLTGLPNRAHFRELVREAVLDSQREQQPMALLIMDLDRFREVNDILGHKLGDSLLQKVSTRLRSALFAPDMIARLGGDEFGILLPRLAAIEDVTVVIKKLQHYLEVPFILDGIPIVVEAAIGVATMPAHASDVETLLQQADIALHHAKKMASGYAIYTPEYNLHTPERLRLVAELRDAIERNQLLLHFQPKVETKTGRIVGTEALVRWQHPRLGLLFPDKFILAAEQTGLIGSLTRWVLHAALNRCQAAYCEGVKMRVSVNLSARSLHDPNLLEMVREALKATGAEPRRLVLEVTESAIVLDPIRAEENLVALSRMGIGLSIDDFGTGYTSLASIKRLPVNEIKIDRSFVTNMLTDKQDATIVRTVIELGHNFGLTVVAEGVETKEVFDALAALGCDEIQGYFISKPQTCEALKSWFPTSPWKIGLTE